MTTDDEARRLIDSALPPALSAITNIDVALAQQDGRLQGIKERLMTAETREDLTTVLALLMSVHDTTVDLTHVLARQLSVRAATAARTRPTRNDKTEENHP